MDGTILGTEIANIVMDSNASEEMKAQILETWQKIGTAIVTHIQTQSVITVTTSAGTGTAIIA